MCSWEPKILQNQCAYVVFSDPDIHLNLIGDKDDTDVVPWQQKNTLVIKLEMRFWTIAPQPYISYSEKEKNVLISFHKIISKPCILKRLCIINMTFQ